MEKFEGLFKKIRDAGNDFWEGMKASPEDIQKIHEMEGEDTPFDFMPMAPLMIGGMKGVGKGLFRYSDILKKNLEPKLASTELAPGVKVVGEGVLDITDSPFVKRQGDLLGRLNRLTGRYGRGEITKEYFQQQSKIADDEIRQLQKQIETIKHPEFKFPGPEEKGLFGVPDDTLSKLFSEPGVEATLRRPFEKTEYGRFLNYLTENGQIRPEDFKYYKDLHTKGLLPPDEISNIAKDFPLAWDKFRNLDFTVGARPIPLEALSNSIREFSTKLVKNYKGAPQELKQLHQLSPRAADKFMRGFEDTLKGMKGYHLGMTSDDLMKRFPIHFGEYAKYFVQKEEASSKLSLTQLHKLMGNPDLDVVSTLERTTFKVPDGTRKNLLRYLDKINDNRKLQSEFYDHLKSTVPDNFYRTIGPKLSEELFLQSDMFTLSYIYPMQAAEFVIKNWESLK